MFADKETMERREASRERNMKIAKRHWRIWKLVLKLAFLAIVATLFYYAGERSGFLACRLPFSTSVKL